MLSVAVPEPGRIEPVEIPEPKPGPYEALLRTEAVCLCNSTDRKLVQGHFPGVDKYPLLLGHETVGVVEEVGDRVRTFKAGDRVVGGLLLRSTDPAYASAWGGFSQYLLAGDHAAMLADGVADAEHGWAEVFEIMRPVPPELSVEDGVMLLTWREVLGGFGDFNLQPGDDILVFGAGPVGLSFIKFARILGLNYVGCIEPMPDKREKALAMGAAQAFAPDDPSLPGLVRARGRPFDAVIDAVGKEAIINAGVELVKLGGSVCVYGVIDTPSIRVEKSRGPYNFNLIVHQWPTRAREAAAQETLCEWIRAERLSYKEFISAEYPIREIQTAFAQSLTGETIKTILRF